MSPTSHTGAMSDRPSEPGPDRFSRAEIRKDAVQSTAEAAARTVGEVATIITAAVKDVAGAIGGFATEVFEIGETARKASEDHED